MAAIYVFYEVSRLLAVPRATLALAHGRDLLSLERWLHLSFEPTLNHFLSQHAALAESAGYYYSVLHFVVTPFTLVYVWQRAPKRYSQLRSALILATAAGLAVFVLWPVAPPRFTMLGLSDTLIQHQIFGMANPHGVSALINPYAAMPSLHVGWALWCAAAFEVASQSAWRHLVWLYPLLTTMVVLATANHYLLDAIAGAALVVAALTLTHRTTSPIVAVRESF